MFVQKGAFAPSTDVALLDLIKPRQVTTSSKAFCYKHVSLLLLDASAQQAQTPSQGFIGNTLLCSLITDCSGFLDVSEGFELVVDGVCDRVVGCLRQVCPVFAVAELVYYVDAVHVVDAIVRFKVIVDRDIQVTESVT